MRIKEQATLDEIAIALNTDKQVIENLVAYWFRKGNIIEHDVKNCQSTCASCHCQAYIWIESSQSGVKL